MSDQGQRERERLSTLEIKMGPNCKLGIDAKII